MTDRFPIVCFWCGRNPCECVIRDYGSGIVVLLVTHYDGSVQPLDVAGLHGACQWNRWHREQLEEQQRRVCPDMAWLRERIKTWPRGAVTVADGKPVKSKTLMDLLKEVS